VRDTMVAKRDAREVATRSLTRTDDGPELSTRAQTGQRGVRGSL
jgi:hypothetical protein